MEEKNLPVLSKIPNEIICYFHFTYARLVAYHSRKEGIPFQMTRTQGDFHECTTKHGIIVD